MKLKKRLVKFLSMLLIAVSTFCSLPTKEIKANVLPEIAPYATSLSLLNGPGLIAAGVLTATAYGIDIAIEVHDTIVYTKWLPEQGKPNSEAYRKDYKGRVIQKRIYDENGDALIDIDYNDHGTPQYHPWGPHIHFWKNGNRGRGKGMTTYEKEIHGVVKRAANGMVRMADKNEKCSYTDFICSLAIGREIEFSHRGKMFWISKTPEGYQVVNTTNKTVKNFGSLVSLEHAKIFNGKTLENSWSEFEAFNLF